MKEPPRYIIRESSGHRINPDASNSGGHSDRPPAVEIMILDRVWDYRLCWSSWAGRSSQQMKQRTTESYRAEARALCRRWNREDALARREVVA